MSSQLFQQLEAKVDQALETIELLKLQLDDAEERNANLQADNAALKNRQVQWESSLATLLRKLEGADLSSNLETHPAESYEQTEENEETEVVA